MTDKYNKHLDAVLENFTKTVKQSRFTSNAIKTVLQGILDEFTESDQSESPAELQAIYSATRPNGMDIEGWRETIWLQRLTSVFTPENGWKSYGPEMSSTIKSIDTGGHVETLDVNQTVVYYSPERNEAVQITRGMFDTTVTIYSNDSIDTKMEKFENLVEQPDPFENRIVKLTRDGAEILDLKADGLEPYSPEAEAAVEWMSTIADPNVREDLRAANLEPRAGLLLEGPPGSGKTTLARREAVRHAGSATVIYPEPDVAIDDIFDFAERHDVSFIILEDVESFFGARGTVDFSDFLNALDGVTESTGLMVMATTNDSSSFDEAVRRPGRLERKAVIENTRDDFMYELLTKRLQGFDSSELDSLARAAYMRASDKKARITPALADSLARAIIMGRMNVTKAIEFVNNEWEPKYEGESYVDCPNGA